MTGTLGIGADLTTFSDDELDEAVGCVAGYKTIRGTVQDGRMDRLDNPSANDYRIVQYTAPDQAAVFVFLPASRIGRRGTRVRLRSLVPDALPVPRQLDRSGEVRGVLDGARDRRVASGRLRLGVDRAHPRECRGRVVTTVECAALLVDLDGTLVDSGTPSPERGPGSPSRSVDHLRRSWRCVTGSVPPR